MNNSEQQCDVKDTGLEVVDETTSISTSRQLLNFITEVASVLIVSLIITFIVINFLYVNALIPSGSMLPTLQVGDRIGIHRLVKFGHFNRGDFLVFRGEDYVHEDILMVKRVIGLPGETVSIKNGVVYINGEILDEPYVKYHSNDDMDELVVPDTDYFVLGDNRANSLDGRYWDIKTVNKKDIIGRGEFSEFQTLIGKTFDRFSDK